MVKGPFSIHRVALQVYTGSVRKLTPPLCLGANKTLEYKREVVTVHSTILSTRPQTVIKLEVSEGKLYQKETENTSPTHIDRVFSCSQGQLVLLLDTFLVVLRVLMQPDLVISDSTAVKYCILLLFPKTPYSQ